MKKIILLSASLFFILTAESHAFIDTAIKTVTGNITAVYDKAYQEFMKVQVIEQTRTMLANYNESKDFYARMKEISDHKGGIVGYVKDDIKNNIDEQNKEVYWKVNRDFVNADGDDSFIGTAIKNTDKRVKSNLDYSEEIHNLNLKRDKNIKTEILEKAADPNLKTADRELLNMKINLTQMEIMNEMNKTMQQVLLRENERVAQEWAAGRQVDIEKEKMKKFLEMARKQKLKNSVDPYKVLGETPK